MSVFQLNDWWSVRMSDGEEFDRGCMVVGNVDNANPPAGNLHYNGDCFALKITHYSL